MDNFQFYNPRDAALVPKYHSDCAHYEICISDNLPSAKQLLSQKPQCPSTWLPCESTRVEQMGISPNMTLHLVYVTPSCLNGNTHGFPVCAAMRDCASSPQSLLELPLTTCRFTSPSGRLFNSLVRHSERNQVND